MPNPMDTAGQACFLLFSGCSWSECSRISESPNLHGFFLIIRAMSNTLQLNLLFELICLTEFVPLCTWPIRPKRNSTIPVL